MLYCAGQLRSDTMTIDRHIESCEFCERKLQDYHNGMEYLKDAQDLAQSLDRTDGFDRKSVSSLLRFVPPGYRTVRELASGGQGVVYEALQLSTSRSVALKILRDGPLARPEDRRRFENEVELAASLNHPGIVQIIDSGAHEGHYYYSMNLVDGEPLNEYMKTRDLSINERITLFCKIADAVNHAHEQGLMHGDLKPSNILLNEHDQPILVDFGLAKRPGLRPSEDGKFSGTLHYASPEQLGSTSQAIGLRSEVYTMGVILYEMLTGRLPYRRIAAIATLIESIRHEPPLDLEIEGHKLAPDLAAILKKVLHKDPSSRYATLHDLVLDLRRYQEHRVVSARSVNGFGVARKFFQRNSIVLGIAGLVATLFASGIGVHAYSTHLKNCELERTAELRARADARFFRIAYSEYQRLLKMDADSTDQILQSQLVELERVLSGGPTRVEAANRAMIEFANYCRDVKELVGTPLAAEEEFRRDVAKLQEELGLSSNTYSISSAVQPKAAPAQQNEAQYLYPRIRDFKRELPVGIEQVDPGTRVLLFPDNNPEPQQDHPAATQGASQ